MITPIAASLIATLHSSLTQPVASSLVKRIFGKGVHERKEGGILPLLAAPSLLKGIFERGVTRAWRGVMRAGRGYHSMDQMDQ